MDNYQNFLSLVQGTRLQNRKPFANEAMCLLCIEYTNNITMTADFITLTNGDDIQSTQDCHEID